MLPEHVRIKAKVSTDGSDEIGPRARVTLSFVFPGFHPSWPEVAQLTLNTRSNGLVLGLMALSLVRLSGEWLYIEPHGPNALTP